MQLAHTSAQTTGVAAAATSPGDAKLKQACSQLEGVFFNMMLKEMRNTVPKDTLLGDSGNQQDIFQSMFDEQVSQKMADSNNGSNSLSDQLYRQLSGSAAYKKEAAAYKVNASTLPGSIAAQASVAGKGLAH